MQHVVFATDKNYWMHLYISLYSLVKNNRDNQFKVFIIADSIDKDFKANLPFLLKMGNLVEVQYLNARRFMFGSVPTSEDVTIATYYRLLIGSLLPKEINKALFLDGDTIIDASLTELFNINIDNYVLAAVKDCVSESHSKRLGLPEGSSYFNAGVMLINLDKWRTLQIEEKLLDYIKANMAKIVVHDQDILNGVLNDNWLEIDPIYNYLEYNDAGFNPDTKYSIIHYIGSPKPWLYMSRYPHKERYWNYLRETPYRGYSEPGRTFLNILLKYTNKNLIINNTKRLVYKNQKLHYIFRRIKRFLFKPFKTL